MFLLNALSNTLSHIFFTVDGIIISSKFFLSFKTHKASDGGGGAEFGTKFLETSVYTWGPNLLHDSKIPPLLTSTKFFPLGLKPVPHDPDNT